MGKRGRLTRRQRALCWCLLLVLIMGCVGLQYRYLCYWKPVREAEEQGDTGKTERIMELVVEERYRPGWRELRGNENAMLLLTISVNGRWTTGRAYLDCTGEAPFHAAVYTNEGENGHGIEVFGRVDDPAGDRVQIRFFWTGEESGIEEHVKTVEIPRYEWIEKEKLAFFGKQFSLTSPTGSKGEMKAKIALLDRAGRELADLEQVVSWYEIGLDTYF